MSYILLQLSQGVVILLLYICVYTQLFRSCLANVITTLHGGQCMLVLLLIKAVVSLWMGSFMTSLNCITPPTGVLLMGK